MLTTIPSPLNPSTVAVTTTSVSWPTKLRMHLSFVWLSPPLCAASSNLRALATPMSSNKLPSHCSVERCAAMAVCAFFFFAPFGVGRKEGCLHQKGSRGSSDAGIGERRVVTLRSTTTASFLPLLQGVAFEWGLRKGSEMDRGAGGRIS